VPIVQFLNYPYFVLIIVENLWGLYLKHNSSLTVSVAAVCFDDFAKFELEVEWAVSYQWLLHPIPVCCHWKLGVAPTSLEKQGRGTSRAGC